jgi:hypothetical protein
MITAARRRSLAMQSPAAAIATTHKLARLFFPLNILLSPFPSSLFIIIVIQIEKGGQESEGFLKKTCNTQATLILRSYTSGSILLRRVILLPNIMSSHASVGRSKIKKNPPLKTAGLLEKNRD